MELVNNEKALYTLFLCAGYGLLCGWVFALISHGFPLKKSQTFRRVIRDIFLSFWSALGLFLLSLPLTDGRPRLSLFVGTILGFFVWKTYAERPFFSLAHRLKRPFSSCCHTIGSFFCLSRVKHTKK